MSHQPSASVTQRTRAILTPLAAMLLLGGCDEGADWEEAYFGYERENAVVQVVNDSGSDIRLIYPFLGGGFFDEDEEERSVVVPADTSQDVRVLMQGYLTIAADVRIEVLATGRTLSRRVYRSAPLMILSNGDLGLSVAN